MLISVFYRFMLLLGAFLSTALAAAAMATSTITGEFEGQGAVGKVTVSMDGDALIISYASTSLGKTLTYSVDKFDECSAMAVYRVPRVPQIAIDGSCSSRGGQIFIKIYEWRRKEANWCLVREITGERDEDVSDAGRPHLEVARVKGCSVPGTAVLPTYARPEDARAEITADLQSFLNASRSKAGARHYVDRVPYYQAAEFASYVDATNVDSMTGFGSTLVDAGRSSDAIPLLQAIVVAFPKAAGAKVSLADAYWETGQREVASAMYAEYYGETAGAERRNLPRRVLERRGP